jgi:hypothetical protein
VKTKFAENNKQSIVNKKEIHHEGRKRRMIFIEKPWNDDTLEIRIVEEQVGTVLDI